MDIKVCRGLSPRNGTTSFASSNQSSNISEAEWATNILSIIMFVLALLGNTAALIVMFGSRGPIRLTNNKYLANLACADLLRACFIPFTVIPRMNKNFIFGRMICKILPIVQGLSVAVDVFTLVCISIERYLAICRPLLILKLQSIRFATLFNCLILFLIWSLGLLIALPNLYMYSLCSLPKAGRFKCEKAPPKEFDERFYMVALDTFYFVIPMVVMIVLYTLIIWKMYRNSTAMKMRSCQNSNPSKARSSSSTPPLLPLNKTSQLRSTHSDTNDLKARHSFNFENKSAHPSIHRSSTKSRSGVDDEDHGQNLQLDASINNRSRSISHPLMCQLSQESHSTKVTLQRLSSQNSSSVQSRYSASHRLSRMDRHRRKALKLLIILIVEFFICWTPLFIYHTIGTFNKNFYRHKSMAIYVDLILLFSFASASCNPLTYYFMSKRYRSVLYAYLTCSFINKNQRMFLNQKNQQARNIIKTFRLHPQQNSLEKKPKGQAARTDLSESKSRSRTKTLH